MSRIFALLVALFFTASSSAADLRIGVAGASPSFLTTDDAGDMTGFNADIARALCAAMRVNCKLIQRQPKDIAAGLLATEYDAAVASLPVTAENEKTLLFTQRYYKNGVKFLRRVGDKTTISYKGLVGKTIGVWEGTLADMFLTAEFDGVDIRRYRTAEETYTALLGGEVSAVIGEQFAQAAVAERMDDIQLSGATYNKAKYFNDFAIAVRPGSDLLRDRFSKAIQTLRDVQIYRDINKRYFPFSIYGP